MENSTSNSRRLEEHTMIVDFKKNYGSVPETKSSSSSMIYSSLAQLWACFGKYVCMINVGIMASFPVLALPFLTSGSFKIKMSENELEWMVSIIYITMAVGSLISVLPFNTNRKVPMMVAQAAMVVSWIITYLANESWQLIMARAIGGISMTLSLPQVQAYIGEVTVPQLRGIFGNLTQTMTIMGQFVMSGLTYLNNWDEAVLISGCLPVLAIIYLYFIPESPVILVKKKKFEKGWSALKQLRGWKWANEGEVIREFRQIQKYCNTQDSEDNSYLENQCSLSTTTDATRCEGKHNKEIAFVEETYRRVQNDFSEQNLLDSKLTLTRVLSGIDNPVFVNNEQCCNKKVEFPTNEDIIYQNISEEGDNQNAKHSSKTLLTQWSSDSINQKPENKNVPGDSILRFLLKPEMYKPTLLMFVCSFFVVGPGADSILIYLKWYIEDFQTPVNYYYLLSLLTVATLLGNLCSVCCVSKIGKRNIILLSTACAGLGYTSLSLMYYLRKEGQPMNHWVFTIILLWIFFMEEFGIRTIYHSLMSEVFPMRGKKIGPMIIVLMICLNGFLVMHNIPTIISSYGTISIIVFDIILNFFGVIFFYIFLFETEGKTLGEIEDLFRTKSDNVSEKIPH